MSGYLLTTSSTFFLSFLPRLRLHHLTSSENNGVVCSCTTCDSNIPSQSIRQNNDKRRRRRHFLPQTSLKSLPLNEIYKKVIWTEILKCEEYKLLKTIVIDRTIISFQCLLKKKKCWTPFLLPLGAGRETGPCNNRGKTNNPAQMEEIKAVMEGCKKEIDELDVRKNGRMWGGYESAVAQERQK